MRMERLVTDHSMGHVLIGEEVSTQTHTQRHPSNLENSFLLDSLFDLSLGIDIERVGVAVGKRASVSAMKDMPD